MEEWPAILFSMAGYALATSASPGPVNALAAMAGSRYGAVRSLRYVLGATVGFVLILALTGLGLGTLIQQSPRLRGGLALAGGVYLMILGIRIARADGHASTAAGRPPGFRNGALAQWLNPKAWIVSLSAVAVYTAGSTHYPSVLLLFCGVFFVVCFVSVLGWVLIGQAARHVLAGGTGLRWLNRVMGLLLLVSVAWLLWQEVISGGLQG